MHPDDDTGATTYTLHDGGVVRVTAAPLGQDDIVAAATHLWRHGAPMPHGYTQTDPLAAWVGVLSQAVHSGGIALGVSVNGGALAGVYVASPSLSDRGQLIERACAGWSDTGDALRDVARGIARQRGQMLVREVVTVSVTTVAV